MQGIKWGGLLSSNKVPDVSLHLALVVLTTKITVHLCATWMHSKSGAVKLPKDLLSQLCQLGNHYPSPISKTTIYVNGPTLVSRTRLYPVPDGHHHCVLPLGLYRGHDVHDRHSCAHDQGPALAQGGMPGKACHDRPPVTPRPERVTVHDVGVYKSIK